MKRDETGRCGARKMKRRQLAANCPNSNVEIRKRVAHHMKAVRNVKTLEERIRDIKAEIEIVIDARVTAVAKESPGVPKGVIRNLLTARAPACACAQYLELTRET